MQRKQYEQKANDLQPKSIQPEQDLIIDVYISEDHKEKLVIRKGELLEDVAAAFVHEHSTYFYIQIYHNQR